MLSEHFYKGFTLVPGGQNRCGRNTISLFFLPVLTYGTAVTRIRLIHRNISGAADMPLLQHSWCFE